MDSSSSSSLSHIEHKRVWELKNRTTALMESDGLGQPRSRAFTMFSKLSDVKKNFISPYWTANGVAGGQSKNGDILGDMRPRTKSSPSSPNSRNVSNSMSASPWTSRAANSMQKRSIKKQQYYGCLEFPPPPPSSSAQGGGGDARTSTGVTKLITFFRLEPAAFEQTSVNDVYQGDEGCPPSPVILEDPENETRWYYRYFLGKEHQNYAGIDNNKTPYFLSVRVDDNPESHKYRAILWQNTGAKKLMLSCCNNENSSNHKSLPVKAILQKFPGMNNVTHNMKELRDPKLQKELLNLEEQEILINFKCGIIFSFCNQKSDDDMLSNEFGNADFDNFLHLLGDKISLENWPRFRGGLDVRTNSTGTHSFYTNFQDYEIIFHVSTLLPYSKGNKQQLERKRHIGNDIVNIIFESGGDPKQHEFRPSFVKSKFTHIFAVVTFDFSVNCYRLWVYSEKSIPAYGPALPNPCEFYDHDKFREFLITKILNGEKAAFRNQTFSEKRFRTMDTLLKDMYIKYLNSAPVRKALSPKISNENGNGHRPPSKIGNRTPQDQQAVKEFLLVGEKLKITRCLSGNPHESCVQTNLLHKQPWEPDLLYSDLPKMDIISADSWDNNSLVCVTELNGVLLIKDKGSILLMDNYCFVQQVRVVETFDLLLVRCEKGKDAYLSAFSLQYVRSVIRASKCLTKKDCFGQKIAGSKGCHVFSMTGNDSFRLTLALCTGRKLSIYRARMKNQQIFDSNIIDFFELIREINCNEEPLKMSVFESGLHADIKIAILTKSELSVLTVDDSSSITVYRPTNTKIVREGTLIVSGDLDTEDILLTSQNSTLIFDLFEDDFSSPLSITWTNNPSSVAYCFPFILAFGSDTIEIRLGVNGNLFASLCMAGVSLLASKEDIFFVTTGESGDGKSGSATATAEPKVRATKSSLPASFLTNAAPYPKPKSSSPVKCSFYKISVKNLLKGGRTSSSHSKATTSASSHGSETKTSFGDSFSASISPGSLASNIGSSSNDFHRLSDDSQYYQFDKSCFVSYKPNALRFAKPSTDPPIDLMNRVSINSDSGLSFESNMNEE